MDGRARLVQRYDPAGRGPAELSVAGGLDTTRTDAVGEAARSRPTETAQRTVRLVAAGCHTNGTYAYGSVILAQSMATGAGGTWHSCSAEFFACQLAPKPIVALTLSQLHLSFWSRATKNTWRSLRGPGAARSIWATGSTTIYCLHWLVGGSLTPRSDWTIPRAGGSRRRNSTTTRRWRRHTSISEYSECRERLRGFGVDANAIVERRRTARQLRIGTSHLSVVHV
jgi:hypothetical protein